MEDKWGSETQRKSHGGAPNLGHPTCDIVVFFQLWSLHCIKELHHTVQDHECRKAGRRPDGRYQAAWQR